MGDEDKKDPGDSSLFRRAVAGVRRIKQDRVAPHARKPKPVPKKTLEDNQAVLGSLLSDDFEAGDVETGEELLYSRPGIQHSVMRRLRTGKYATEGELDLHGLTVPQAREALGQFLRDAQFRGWRCVRIIHGKGLSSAGRIPVLKQKINGWLPQRDEVLAFCSALPVDGGTGAVYVLLKRRGSGRRT
jgi:DNA-nicking Smr family endonuclease